MAGVALTVLWVKGERGRLLRRSTAKFFKEGGRLHGYVYGRWTRQYINFLLNHMPSDPKRGQWLADRYHGKVLTHEHARSIVMLDRPVPLQDLDQIVPYPVARKLVLDGPPDVAAYECVCRAVHRDKFGPAACGPSQVCMVVGQPFVDFVLEHHPDSARRLTQEEAVRLLDDQHERGHVHSAWFKDAMMGRFYAICNCCKCCCAGIGAMKRGMRMVASSGYVARLDSDSCARCGTCVEACAFDALSLGEEHCELNWVKCMGCGVCESKCPSQAIALVRDEAKGIPLDVRALVAPAVR